jgi:uncharacterized protein
MRVVLDTNVWLSGLFWGGKPGVVVDWVAKRDHGMKVIFSEATLAELISKLNIYDRKFEKVTTHRFGNMFRGVGEIIPSPHMQSEIKVRDPKDQMWVDLCMISQANYLVSGDKDLLVLKKIGKTRVVTINDFIRVGVDEVGESE